MILQFGTSRFLLAHADLFVSEALARGEAAGRITVVQTTGSPQSARRIEALAGGRSYPVRIRGLQGGQTIDRTVECHGIADALDARADWPAIRRAAMTAGVVISNTGDRGFDLHDVDDASRMADRGTAPSSFPAKIAALLLERAETNPDDPISIFPCELVSRNGDRLKALVAEVARTCSFPEHFDAYLDRSCRFANSLVDRVVSEAIEPVGAVAEPHALWAIERQDGLVLPCAHPAIVLTDDLPRFEALKLHILNLGHTVLADLWQAGAKARVTTVRDIMNDAPSRATVEAVWRDEVVPVFAARGLGAEAQRYVDEVRERFLNPFLAHNLADIAANHTEKKRRRIEPILDARLPQPILSAIMLDRA